MMDNRQFDELTRRLGSGTSRRGVLKGIAAGIGASVFGFTLRQSPQASAGNPACESTDDCDAGYACEEGICVPDDSGCGEGGPCETGYSCVDGTCVEDEPICAGDGEPCGEIPCCDEEQTCFQGTCGFIVCSGAGDPCSEIACCSESGLVCVEGYCEYDEPTCAGYNEACSFPEVAVAASLDGSNCCEGYCLEGICVPDCIGQGGDCKADDECCSGHYCSDKYTCEPIPACGEVKDACKDDYDCCGGLICEKGICVPGTCGVPGDACEMVEDHGCCPGLTCFEAQCDNPSGLCMDQWEYCDGKNFVCCKGLVCGGDSFCHPEKDDDGGKPDGGAKPKPPASTGGTAVTTLPSTGSGDGPDGASWINAAALGGAAAIVGGALLRKKQAETESESAG